MITLATFGPNGDLPDSSPFVFKTMAQLRLAGLAYEVRSGLGAMRGAPNGKLPYIVDDGVVIADSDMIERHITARHGFDFYAGYDQRDRAIAHAVEEMIEERFYFLIVHARWIEPTGWPHMRAYLQGMMPGLVKYIVPHMARRRVARMLHAQGIGRHAESVRAIMADADLDALVTLLGDRPYLLGDRPAGVDASMFAMLASAASARFPGPLRDAVLARPTLTAYVARMRETTGLVTAS